MHGTRWTACNSRRSTNSVYRKQHREAWKVMDLVNKHLDPTPFQDRKAHTRCIDFLRNVCVTVLCVFDRVKMWTRNPALPSSEQTGLRKDRLDVEMHDPREPWTMQTAFHATSGVCVYRSKYTTGRTMTTLDLDVLKFLASKEPATLLPVKIAASQNPGQATGIVKTLTCVQAIWFCSQCIARMGTGMAISLLELNTFAHCVSAFFIYGFWWHKPYDNASHAFIQSSALDFLFLKRRMTRPAAGPNVREARFELCARNDNGAEVVLAFVNLCVLLDAGRNDGANDVRVTEGDSIPGTGFFFRESKTPRSGDCIVLLSSRSLARWQQLWQPASEILSTPSSEDLRWASLRPSERVGNSHGSGDFFEATMSFMAVFEYPFSYLGMTTSANVAFLTYGGLHLFAWQYHFRSTAEAILWKIAAVLTASSGLVAFLPLIFGISWRLSSPRSRKHIERARDTLRLVFFCLVLAWIPVNMIARTYLFVESFVALPNSPPSTYTIPPWTAYVPHI